VIPVDKEGVTHPPYMPFSVQHFRRRVTALLQPQPVDGSSQSRV